MPIRVRSKPVAARDASPMRYDMSDLNLPDIDEDESFREIIKKLSVFFASIDMPSTFEQLRTTSAGDCLRTLVEHLNMTCTNPAIVNALLALKWHYDADNEHHGLSGTRAHACEIVAWRFLGHLSEREAVDYCLYEIPDLTDAVDAPANGDEEANETSPLMSRGWSSVGNRRSLPRPGSNSKRSQILQSLSRLTMSLHTDESPDGATPDDPTLPFRNLNALEIAAIANAKRFLSQYVVQKIITGIWNGDIVFWDSLSAHATKKPRYYNAKTSDPFSRLRVPKYLKTWEVLFFLVFLCLYYAVLVERNPERVSTIEIFLYIWLASFCYDEVSEWIDAGSIFYTSDVWNLFDMIIIGIGIVFAVLRIVGVSNSDPYLIELSFDVLSLEALFMVPRIFSILSLSPYWGTLIPCLKEMGKDFLKFMVLVVIVYLGFLTTFSLVGRDSFTLSRMTMILTKIFFGSSYVGFDVMDQIDEIFGPPLMIIFITLTSILLTGSMTGILSNSFSRVISSAREEYLYVYSIYVLEASTSNRLTHFFPPFNLIALFTFRPLRLFLPNDNRFRSYRIYLLKATHLPIVAAIKLYETIRNRVQEDEYAGFRGPRKAARNRRPPVGGRRPSSSYRPGMPSPRNSDHLTPQRPSSYGNVDEPVSMESRMNDLTRKIDKLTQIVLTMQEHQIGYKGDDGSSLIE